MPQFETYTTQKGSVNMTNLDKTINKIPPEYRPFARRWLPVLKRWIRKEGEEAVAEWMFASCKSGVAILAWYGELLRHMTNAELRAEDKRRLKACEELHSALIKRRRLEQMMFQRILLLLISKI